MTSVSIALATCDGERFLREQLESLARQTVAPHELVVGDDRSADGTLALLASFARDSPFPVRIEVNNERLGAGENFLRVASRCEGDHVAFCDQDDVWLAEKLERCIEAFGDPGVRLVVHACTVVDASLRALGVVVPSIEETHVEEPFEPPRWGQAPGMAMVFDRELLSVLPWQERPAAHHRHERLLHDEWVYGVGRIAGRTALLAKPLVLYRQHGVNVEGAPDQGLIASLGRAATVGHDYYARRAAQAADWAGLLHDGPYAAEGATWARLAATLGSRAAVYDGSRRERLRRLGGAIAGGAYSSRSREGFGVRGLARDAAMIVLGR